MQCLGQDKCHVRVNWQAFGALYPGEVWAAKRRENKGSGGLGERRRGQKGGNRKIKDAVNLVPHEGRKDCRCHS